MRISLEGEWRGGRERSGHLSLGLYIISSGSAATSVCRGMSSISSPSLNSSFPSSSPPVLPLVSPANVHDGEHVEADTLQVHGKQER